MQIRVVSAQESCNGRRVVIVVRRRGVIVSETLQMILHPGIRIVYFDLVQEGAPLLFLDGYREPMATVGQSDPGAVLKCLTLIRGLYAKTPGGAHHNATYQDLAWKVLWNHCKRG